MLTADTEEETMGGGGGGGEEKTCEVIGERWSVTVTGGSCVSEQREEELRW